MKKVDQAIGKELKLFEQHFEKSTYSDKKLLQRIMKFIIRQKGKQMRPMFVLLSAQIAGGIKDGTYRAASMIELLHTATLVHDDIVDNSMQRRSFFSLNALFKNKMAVLIGDYLLARGLLLAIQNNDIPILEITSKAVQDLSEGEIFQMEKARKLDITEDVYFEIIRAKTASLLAASCAAGAYSAEQSLENKQYFHEFGEKIGIAFQIKDDLMDYGSDKIGKPTGIDIKEKKMTLPLIYTLQQCDASTRKKIIYIIKNHNTDKSKVQEVIAEVKKWGGIEYATEKMYEYQTDALKMLEKFPDSMAKEAMVEIVNYVIDRKI